MRRGTIGSGAGGRAPTSRVKGPSAQQPASPQGLSYPQDWEHELSQRAQALEAKQAELRMMKER